MHTHTKLNVCINAYNQYTHTYTYKLYTHRNIANLNAHPCLNIPIIKKHIRDNIKINCNLLF